MPLNLYGKLEPNWKYWILNDNNERTTMENAVLLSVNLEPANLLYLKKEMPEQLAEFTARFAETEEDLADCSSYENCRKFKDCPMSLGIYAHYCLKKGWQIPASFPRFNDDVGPLWEKWRDFPDASLEDIVFLSCDISPNRVSHLRKDSELMANYHHRLEVVKADLGKNLTPEEDGHIAWDVFAVWAEAKGWDLPEKFPRHSPSLHLARSAESRWPWGAYETKCMVALDVVVRRFWSDWKPHTVAPSKKKILNVLEKEFHLSGNEAEAIAKVARHDSFKRG